MIEQTLLQAGIKSIAGVDEAGRGPCAGPLVVAAVVLSDPFSPALSQVKDSKELTESKREELFDVVVNTGIEKNSLSSCSFTRINVSHNSNVADLG